MDRDGDRSRSQLEDELRRASTPRLDGIVAGIVAGRLGVAALHAWTQSLECRGIDFPAPTSMKYVDAVEAIWNGARARLIADWPTTQFAHRLFLQFGAREALRAQPADVLEATAMRLGVAFAPADPIAALDAWDDKSPPADACHGLALAVALEDDEHVLRDSADRLVERAGSLPHDWSYWVWDIVEAMPAGTRSGLARRLVANGLYVPTIPSQRYFSSSDAPDITAMELGELDRLFVTALRTNVLSPESTVGAARRLGPAIAVPRALDLLEQWRTNFRLQWCEANVGAVIFSLADYDTCFGLLLDDVSRPLWRTAGAFIADWAQRNRNDEVNAQFEALLARPQHTSEWGYGLRGLVGGREGEFVPELTRLAQSSDSWLREEAQFALHRAGREGRAALVCLLFEPAADVELVFDEYGGKPLETANAVFNIVFNGATSVMKPQNRVEPLLPSRLGRRLVTAPSDLARPHFDLLSLQTATALSLIDALLDARLAPVDAILLKLALEHRDREVNHAAMLALKDLGTEMSIATLDAASGWTARHGRIAVEVLAAIRGRHQ